MSRRWYSLGLILPLAALAAFVLISGLSFWLTGQSHEHAMLERIHQQAQREAARLARLAGTDVDGGALAGRELALLASETDVAEAALIDADGRVLAALRADWRGREIDALAQGWDAARFASVMAGARLDARLETGGNRLTVLMPWGGDRRGAVYLAYDLGEAVAAERRENLAHRLPDLGAALVLTLLLALWLHRRLARPLDTLADASRRVAEGDLTARVSAGGFREVADLATEFNQAIESWRRDRDDLTSNQARLRGLVRAIPDLVWLKDPDGVYLICNPAFERFFGAPEADIVGKTDYDFVDAELADFFLANDRAAMAAETPCVNEEWVTLAADGRRVLLETVKTSMRDSDGRLVGVLGIGRDITEHRRLEDALRLERDRGQLYLDLVEMIIVVLDNAGRIVLINRKGRELLGYREAELIGADWFELCLPPGVRESLFQGVHQRVMRGETLDVEYIENPVRTRAGGERLIAWRNTLLRDADGKVIASLSVGEDITERQATVEALAQREEQLRTLINAMPDIVCFKDGEGR